MVSELKGIKNKKKFFSVISVGSSDFPWSSAGKSGRERALIGFINIINHLGGDANGEIPP
jgi:hypothetical protein